ncbi:MAG: LEA type 2 family protein [Desulfohalobiaceae bacterium]|nr:LEA type 2 family protein [Desulfohalobiaceae bacterium]
MRYRAIAPLIPLLAAVLILSACAGMKKTKPSASNFQKPEVSLASFQVPQYDGYWYYAKSIEPTMGQAGNHGAPLPMSFLFRVDNPNPYPVKISNLNYSISFEGFTLKTVNNQDDYWIPAKGSDHIRSTTMITVRSAILSLKVASGFKLKEKGWSAPEALQRWWSKIPKSQVPVQVKRGRASFQADGVSKVVTFEGTYPRD